MGADGSRPAEVDPEELAEKQREILRMDQIVRNKVRSGVQYNMKVILRGERGSGKTSLWKRFQALPYEENYQPTAEIQSATINWSFKNNEDHVKVEVWDVVDKAIKSKTLTKPDGSASFGKNKIEHLDASVVDVYKDTNAVIFMINPLATQSLNYVKEKLKEVPHHVSVLLLLNFKDLMPEKDFALSMNRKRREDLVTFDDVLQVCETLRMHRRKRRMENQWDFEYASHHCDVYACEASLMNCYGLQQLHRFLDVPFLQLKTKALRDHLRVAVSDLQEADRFLQDSIHGSSYTDFEQKHEARRQKAIERDFTALENAGKSNVKNDDDTSSSEEVSPRHSRSKNKKNKTHPKEENDELALSLRSKQFEKETAQLEATSSLKLEHEVAGKSSKSKLQVKKSKSESNYRTSNDKVTKSQFDLEVDGFQPNLPNQNESLEGFLEPSDEEEKRIYASKQRIKAYAKKVEKKSDSDSSSDQPKATTKYNKAASSSDSEDYNHKLSQTALKEKKNGVGKLVKRSKKKEETVATSFQSLSIQEPEKPKEVPLKRDEVLQKPEVKSRKSSKATKKNEASSDDDLPAVMKFNSSAPTRDSSDDEEEKGQAPIKMSKLSRPVKKKSSIPKEVDL